MKVISFLGTATYKSTTYVWDTAEHTSQFFPAAVAQFVKPEMVLICATPTVQVHPNLSALTQQLDEIGMAWKVIPIPEGHSENDLWRIFDALTEAVEIGERVTFDVTHSFRSLPILAFLAVAYLKAAKQVKVERVLYGAWEAREEATNRSPVFDLTPFTTLLDWLTATNRFVETGDGQALAQLLRAGMPPGDKMRDDLAARLLGRQLKSASEAIESVSLALRVTRPIEAMQSAAQLTHVLAEAQPGIAQQAKPFEVLAEQVAREYGQFAIENPTNPEWLTQNLERQLQMIDWYLKRRQVVQAATLAREWVVSTLAVRFNEPMFDVEQGRKYVEAALNNAVEQRKPNPRPLTPSRCDAQLGALPQAENLARVWAKLTEMRNDIAHVGMNVAPKPAALLKQKMESLYPNLAELAADLAASTEKASPQSPIP